MANRINIGPKGSKLDWDNWGKPVTDAINEYDTEIIALTPGAWSTITLLNGWSNRAGYAPASYRKIFNGSTLQIVLNLTAGTKTDSTILFTLPAAFWPLAVTQMPLIGRIQAAPQQMSALEIGITGNCRIFDVGSGTTVLHGTGMIPLDLV